MSAECARDVREGIDSIYQSTHNAITSSKNRVKNISQASQRDLEQPSVSLTRQMRDLSKEERAKITAAAAGALCEYYCTDPEMQEWQALDSEDFYDLEETMT